MGLDIIALSNIRKSTADNARHATPHSAFPAQSEDVEAGQYEGEKEHGFRAGSYSGYNEWRNELAVMAGFENAAQVWGLKEGPFFELINFSDCEGCIGSKTAAKLAIDFAKFQATAEAKRDHYFLATYNLFRKAFETASDKGVVIFT